jgi:hypothetical protein
MHMLDNKIMAHKMAQASHYARLFGSLSTCPLIEPHARVVAATRAHAKRQQAAYWRRRVPEPLASTAIVVGDWTTAMVDHDGLYEIMEHA